MVSFATASLFSVTVYFAWRWYTFEVFKSKLRAFPTLGGDGFLTSYISAWRNLFRMHERIKEGYTRFPNSGFKVPTLFTKSGWVIVLNGQDAVDDIRKALPDQLSFRRTAIDGLQLEYLSDADVQTQHDPYHVNVIRVPLTRGFPARFGEVIDEIKHTTDELMPVSGSEWTSYPLHKNLLRVVSRTSNRVLVGLPMCRNEEYLSLNENLTIHLFTAASFLQLFPTFLRPFLAKLISKDPATNHALGKLLEPIFKERIEKEEKEGKDWEGRPNDLITWLLEAAPPHCRFLKDMVQRLMVLNVASIHTTTMTTDYALFNLAARPEYQDPLRAEIEEVVEKYGWTKEAMGKMYKLDSFLKESSRFNSIGSMSLARYVLKDFVFYNGLVVPEGSNICVASNSRFTDPTLFPNPENFDGFRFVSKADSSSDPTSLDSIAAEEGQVAAPPGSAGGMVSLDLNYLLWGHGRFACPGRFFAVAEMKAILAHFVVNYDMKLPGDKNEAPAGMWFAGNFAPDMEAHVVLRRRARTEALKSC